MTKALDKNWAMGPQLPRGAGMKIKRTTRFIVFREVGKRDYKLSSLDIFVDFIVHTGLPVVCVKLEEE